MLKAVVLPCWFEIRGCSTALCDSSGDFERIIWVRGRVGCHLGLESVISVLFNITSGSRRTLDRRLLWLPSVHTGQLNEKPIFIDNDE